MTGDRKVIDGVVGTLRKRARSLRIAAWVTLGLILFALIVGVGLFILAASFTTLGSPKFGFTESEATNTEPNTDAPVKRAAAPPTKPSPAESPAEISKKRESQIFALNKEEESDLSAYYAANERITIIKFGKVPKTPFEQAFALAAKIYEATPSKKE
jgi:hypothetical protein